MACTFEQKSKVRLKAIPRNRPQTAWCRKRGYADLTIIAVKACSFEDEVTLSGTRAARRSSLLLDLVDLNENACRRDHGCHLGRDRGREADPKKLGYAPECHSEPGSTYR